MDEFKKYKRTKITEIRPVTKEDISSIAMREVDLDNNIKISVADIINGSPKIGDMIARNPKDHNDKWLVAKKYFEDNFEILD